MSVPKSREPGSVAKHQRYEMRRMSRREIKGAPYNPRRIDPHARRKLEANLRRVGLLRPLIWNETTGNLVEGHQRIKLLDAIEKTDDYQLDVAVVRLDADEERRQVVFLNNESAMSHWDPDALSKMLTDGLDRELAGFDAMDLTMLLGDLAPAAEPPAAEPGASAEGASEDSAPPPDPIQEAAARAAQIEQIKRTKKAARERARERDDSEFFLVAVFMNREQCTKALDLLGLPTNEKYVDGARILTALQSYYKKEAAVG